MKNTLQGSISTLDETQDEIKDLEDVEAEKTRPEQQEE